MTKEETILAFANFGKRLFDKDSVKTTVGTISGTTLIGIGVPLINMGDPVMVGSGALLCVAGVGLIWYKEYKGTEEESAEKEAE